MPENEEELSPDQSTNCEVRSLSLPDKFAERYSSARDPATETDIARYVEIEARDESVKHVELIKTEYVLGDKYEIWDVVTDKNRWWVVTNLTNLYSQAHFPSLDYTLSFHIGLMMRIQSRPAGPESDDPTPFDEVFRRQEQAKSRFDRLSNPRTIKLSVCSYANVSSHLLQPYDVEWNFPLKSKDLRTPTSLVGQTF